jgi:putative endonuclease
MAKNQLIGQWGEKIAEKFFEEKGYVVIERNFRTPYGELDLIVRNLEGIVFVEVKTRTSDTFGFPETAITKIKKSHMIQSAEAFMQSYAEISSGWRIDVLAIQGRPGGKNISIEWFENVT